MPDDAAEYMERMNDKKACDTESSDKVNETDSDIEEETDKSVDFS